MRKALLLSAAVTLVGCSTHDSDRSSMASGRGAAAGEESRLTQGTGADDGSSSREPSSTEARRTEPHDPRIHGEAVIDYSKDPATAGQVHPGITTDEQGTMLDHHGGGETN